LSNFLSLAVSLDCGVVFDSSAAFALATRQSPPTTTATINAREIIERYFSWFEIVFAWLNRYRNPGTKSS